ncbi:hypothetical protein AC03_2027 [Escherichia coli 3-073-06_S3_C1]|jgi:hypothetical protein|nr:hypothetical protein FORC29_2369 [Escherichia coli]ASQ66868.1 hypothetical protein A610_1889 [Escherichia coli NCCP15648]EGR60062.1 hypothetical protein HUSEC41_27493 [Escherichia coli O104:H4 str. 01-09591]EHF31175.1 hypothetical protein EUDG_00726 [Escherichia coli O104:H4 str. 04-8351]EHF34564.1 hypothetical protein EUEG_02047 [Escherichia coli O104:H4 str. 09-7901]KDA79985.1 hypothetical protein AC13_1658 [Escherichia coli 2-011-08_S3_C2]KDT57831.1 hypothetical protein AB76_4501 [Esche
MRIFKNAWFERFARKTKYPTNHCAKLLNRLITGLSQQTWVTALSSNVCHESVAANLAVIAQSFSIASAQGPFSYMHTQKMNVKI